MSPIRYDETIMRLIRDVNEIKSALRRTVANLPLFDIANENTPTTLSADQNDYVPGNYDILRLSSTANVTITGIANGKKGRRLQIFNVGSFSITLAHSSSSSLAANRFDFVNDSDFIIPPSGNVLIYYDSTLEKWVGGDMASIYDVVNEVTPSQITSDQNNYDIGLSEVLRLSSDAERTITGFSGGVKGRSLRIFNVGSYPINISHQSTSSSAANRVISPTGFAAIIPANGEVTMYYDSTQLRWIVSYTSNSNRISAEVRLSANYSVEDSTYTGILWETETSDTGNFWSLGNPIYFVIPVTGWYQIQVTIVWDVNGTGNRLLHFYDSTVTKVMVWDTRTAVSDMYTIATLSDIRYFTAGDQYGVEVRQNSGGALNIIPSITLGPLNAYTRFTIVKL